MRLGDLHFAGQEYDKARRAYHRAVQAEPGTESAAYALLQEGRCWNQARQYRKALRCYDAFLTAYKGSQYADDALLRAGVIYVGPLHDAAKGARLYTTILERYPDSNAAETALYHLATLAFWDRDWERARDAHERFLAHYPHGRYADFVRKQRLPAIQMALTR